MPCTPSKGFLIYLALLSMLGFLATDMYLPAFSLMQNDFDTNKGVIGASLSVFLAGFAFAQGIWGSLSDRLGRKKVLLMGLSLFILGCAGMFWVTDHRFMLFWRFIQAVGVCSASVSWQALVIDRYKEIEARRVFATIMPLVALSPALAPLFGAWLLIHFSWRMIFVVLALLAIILFLHTLALRTTKISADVRQTQRRRFIDFLSSRFYSGNILIYSACSAGFFAWLTGSPFILHNLGLAPSDIGLSYIPQTLAFLFGGYACRAALRLCESKTLLPGLLALYSLSLILLFCVAMREQETLITLLIPFCGMALANGAIYPIVVANALLPFPGESGKAAALQNMLQLSLCFIASLAVSTWLVHPLKTTVSVMLSTVLFAGIGYILQKRH